MSNATLEMACLFADRKALSDLTGSLTTVSELLKSIDPCLVLLADGNGKIIVADEVGSGVNLDVAGELALCMATRLLGANRNECSFEFPTELGMSLAFAVRLPLHAEEALFGGLVRLSNRSQHKLDSLRATLRVCGTLAWTAIRAQRAADEAQMRAKTLLAQQTTLEASHVEATNGAILEREERIRQKLASDARMNAVLKTAADGIIVTDERGAIETFNAAAQAIEAEEVFDLGGGNEDRDAVGEADGDGAGNELDRRAQAGEAHDDQAHEAGHEADQGKAVEARSGRRCRPR